MSSNRLDWSFGQKIAPPERFDSIFSPLPHHSVSKITKRKDGIVMTIWRLNGALLNEPHNPPKIGGNDRGTHNHTYPKSRPAGGDVGRRTPQADRVPYWEFFMHPQYFFGLGKQLNYFRVVRWQNYLGESFHALSIRVFNSHSTKNNVFRFTPLNFPRLVAKTASPGPEVSVPTLGSWEYHDFI